MQRFLLALLVGGIIGAIVGYGLKYGVLDRGKADGPPSHTVENDMSAEIREGAAWQYAKAYQDGNWSRVIELTLWMEERLAFVARSGTTEDVASERGKLMADISLRNIADNTLRDEGVEDQYVFTPGATLAWVGEDEGRIDLAAPVEKRVWLNVVFPAREKALLDREGLPIQSINVGINVSEDGHILKAGVTGNLDIDWDSIRYNWPSQ